MRINKVNFSDIVDLLKTNLNLNIFELSYKLDCSEGVIYRRMIPEGYRGLSGLKEAIREGKL
ncbi:MULTISPECIES: hypothetical protein [Methanobacterium]|uniref:Uncharacterized protein n=1 Tax=Methanobacterium veterum TaxID=408577 RepID=A0A9E4ZYY2_9EURY|nr:MULTISPECIES: hypothetical protein [Methanobacterium]MCZ3366666.1 hypothetical protein [Methanobacterium veterum]MCZ3374189.1 hypothetical protein [Methanobacterium veterum]